MSVFIIDKKPVYIEKKKTKYFFFFFFLSHTPQTARKDNIILNNFKNDMFITYKFYHIWVA